MIPSFFPKKEKKELILFDAFRSESDIVIVQMRIQQYYILHYPTGAFVFTLLPVTFSFFV